MCYLEDEIANGVDACLLFGLDFAPQRNYQEVGAQIEQCQFLHLLAAVQLQKASFGQVFPGNLCGYAIPENGLSVNNVMLRLPNNNQVSLGDLLKLNEAVAEFLLLFKKLIDPLPGFSFVPTLPGNFRKILSRLERSSRISKKQICDEVGTSLESTEKKITELYNWFVSDDGLLPRSESSSFRNFSEADIKITSNEYEKLKRHPMDFIRRWCNKMADIQVPTTDDYAQKLCNKLKDTLYECLNKDLFSGRFF